MSVLGTHHTPKLSFLLVPKQETEQQRELVLDGLLIAEDDCLVGHDDAHVSTKGLHILADEDPVLLGLISVGLETSSEVEHLVL